jgi:hypothetical protein
MHAAELQRRGNCLVVFTTLQQDYSTASRPPIAPWLARLVGTSPWFALWSEQFADFAASRISAALGGISLVVDEENGDWGSAYVVPDEAAAMLV